MLQRLDCSKCGINQADKPLIALPMTYICHDCYKKQKSLEERIKKLKTENKRLKEQLKNYCDNCAHLDDWSHSR